MNRREFLKTCFAAALGPSLTVPIPAHLDPRRHVWVRETFTFAMPRLCLTELIGDGESFVVVKYTHD